MVLKYATTRKPRSESNTKQGEITERLRERQIANVTQCLSLFVLKFSAPLICEMSASILPDHFYHVRWHSFGRRDEHGHLHFPKLNTGIIWLSGQGDDVSTERETFTYLGYIKAKSEFEAIRILRKSDPDFIDSVEYDVYNWCTLADDHFVDGKFIPRGDRFVLCEIK
jgi:hypothetical protein